MDTVKQQLAQQQGEFQLFSRQAKQAKDRLETITYELNSLLESTQGSDNRKKELAAL